MPIFPLIYGQLEYQQQRRLNKVVQDEQPKRGPHTVEQFEWKLGDLFYDVDAFVQAIQLLEKEIGFPQELAPSIVIATYIMGGQL